MYCMAPNRGSHFIIDIDKHAAYSVQYADWFDNDRCEV